ncbi:MAG: hypothetical protein DMG50_06840 [Acidobacteria bacterium]|nr:MAG: hypothetical protein DMG50_06840 [Acidobacteriota bacterium]
MIYQSERNVVLSERVRETGIKSGFVANFDGKAMVLRKRRLHASWIERTFPTCRSVVRVSCLPNRS